MTAAGKPRPAGVRLLALALVIATCLVLGRCLFSHAGPTHVAGRHGEVQQLRNLYLNAVRDSITGVHLQTPYVAFGLGNASELAPQPFHAKNRAQGKDWPLYGLSMAGTTRLNHFRELIEAVLQKGVPGSIVECGVWRGGASLFAKAVLAAHGAQDRQVHLVDSFQGLPPNTTAQDNSEWSRMKYLSVSKAEVRAGFERFGLLDNSVHFHKGYFRYSLPAWREHDDGPVAILRMDGDMFESTMDQLYNLWNAVPGGGYVVVDDWGAVPECEKAVLEFCERHRLTCEIQQLEDGSGWLQKQGADAPISMDWYEQFNSSRSSDDAGTNGGESRRRRH